jgi:hypothetical protein
MACTLPVGIHTLKIGSQPERIICYPRVYQVHNRKFERYMNRSIVNEVQSLIDLQAGDSPSTVESMVGWYEIKNNQRELLSLSVANNTYHHQAAHPMTYMKSLTFDLKGEKRCSLKDFFKPGSDYINRISDLIKLQLKQRDITLISNFDYIKPDQDFYVADKTLVIYFQLYDITPYAFGFPLFPISVYDLQDIVDESGSLGRMATND